jgi:hypothetical protein
MKRLIPLTLLTLLLAACAGQWTYVRDQESRHISSGRYDLTLPAHWVMLQRGDSLIVSRDGPDLQKIVLTTRPLDEAFPKIKQHASRDALPSDLSAHFIAELRAEDEQGLPSLKVEEEGPATLAGHPGFRVRASYSTGDGVRYHLLAYGAADDKGYVQLFYTAPAIHYFERNLADFEALRASLRLH